MKEAIHDIDMMSKIIELEIFDDSLIIDNDKEFSDYIDKTRKEFPKFKKLVNSFLFRANLIKIIPVIIFLIVFVLSIIIRISLNDLKFSLEILISTLLCSLLFVALFLIRNVFYNDLVARQIEITNKIQEMHNEVGKYLFKNAPMEMENNDD